MRSFVSIDAGLVLGFRVAITIVPLDHSVSTLSSQVILSRLLAEAYMRKTSLAYKAICSKSEMEKSAGYSGPLTNIGTPFACRNVRIVVHFCDTLRSTCDEWEFWRCGLLVLHLHAKFSLSTP